MKDIRDLFRQKKEIEPIKDRILRDIKNLFEHEEKKENYYKPVRIKKMFGVTITLNTIATVIEIKHCQLKIILISKYLKDIINNFKKSDTLKIQ